MASRPSALTFPTTPKMTRCRLTRPASFRRWPPGQTRSVRTLVRRLRCTSSTVTVTPSDCHFPGTDCWDGKERANVVDVIHNTSFILTDFAQRLLTAGDPGLAQDALKFHFIGDIHQPLVRTPLWPPLKRSSVTPARGGYQVHRGSTTLPPYTLPMPDDGSPEPPPSTSQTYFVS